MRRSIACRYTRTSAPVSVGPLAPSLRTNPWQEWVSGQKGYTVQWSTGQTGQVAYHSVKLEQPQSFTEAYDQANDGTAFYAMSLVSDDMALCKSIFTSPLSHAQGAGQSTGWQTCQDTVCYETFFSSGALSSKNDNTAFRAIST